MANRDRGVSEFTGVAILIGMTILVTATVGVAVLVSPGEADTGPPQANFTFQHFDRSSSVLITFSQGEKIAAGNISIRSERARATWAELAGQGANATTMVGPGASVQASNRNAFGEPIGLDTQLRVVYVGPNGTTTTLSKWNGAS